MRKHDIILGAVILCLVAVIVVGGIAVANILGADSITIDALNGTIGDMQEGYSRLAGTAKNIERDNRQLKIDYDRLVKASSGFASGIDEADRAIRDAIETAKRIRSLASQGPD